MGKPNTIFLVGMPSSGKSTLGKSLARILGFRFLDTDRLIVQKSQQTIPQLFELKGEAYFREVERQVLWELPKNVSLVVAMGGGLPCFFDNMDVIQRTGISVFLDVPVESLAKRIRQHALDDRPLLSNIQDLEAELSRKYEQRLPYYSKATLRITEGTTPTALSRQLQPYFY